MNKSSLAVAVGLALGTTSFGAQASLTSSAVLTFYTGVTVCILDDCSNYGTNVIAGSWFATDVNASGSVDAFEKVAIAAHDGIHIGFTQPASGSHSGSPFGAANNYTGTHLVWLGFDTMGSPIYLTDGNGNNVTQTTTEVPGVDEPWNFFDGTGMHYLTKPVTMVNDQGSTKFLDFSGWIVAWNGIPDIPMTTGAWVTGTNYYNNGAGNGNGVARILCSSSTCSQTSTFTLDYFATVPLGDPSGFGGVKYTLHLVGYVSSVPVPASVWLFGSGLLGLAAAARRRRKSAA